MRWCIENPKQSLAKVDWGFDFFANGVPLAGRPLVTAPVMVWRGRPSELRLTIGMHNPATRMVDGETFDLAVVVPSAVIGARGARSCVMQPNGVSVCNLPRLSSIFPGGWESVVLDLLFEVSTFPDEPLELILRLFKEVGTEDYPFILSATPVDGNLPAKMG